MGIITAKPHSKRRICEKHIRYTCARENILQGFKNVGAETKLFSLRGLWSGVAAGAANLGVNDKLFKKHGRRKLEKVKDGYIHQIIKRK